MQVLYFNAFRRVKAWSQWRQFLPIKQEELLFLLFKFPKRQKEPLAIIFSVYQASNQTLVIQATVKFTTLGKVKGFTKPLLPTYRLVVLTTSFPSIIQQFTLHCSPAGSPALSFAHILSACVD